MLLPLMSFLSSCYFLVVKIRRFSYLYGLKKNEELFLFPVISVGNLSMGGTGKTPMTTFLANYFNLEKKKKVAVAMRAHRSKVEKKELLLKKREGDFYDPLRFGDEAGIYWHAPSSPFLFLGRKRSLNIKKHLKGSFFHLLLLDDGFQHYQIRRDVDILLLDSMMSLEAYTLVPKGSLRVPFSEICHSDIIIFTRWDLISLEKQEKLKQKVRSILKEEKPLFFSRSKITSLIRSDTLQEISSKEVQESSLLLISGIGNPASFEMAMKELSRGKVEHLIFEDHSSFENLNWDDALKKIPSMFDYIVVTEKDFMKIKKIIRHPSLLIVKSELDFFGKENELLTLIDELIKKRFPSW